MPRKKLNPVAFCSCGSRGVVRDTRMAFDYIRRRHACQRKSCRRRWTTIEYCASTKKGKELRGRAGLEKALRETLTQNAYGILRSEIIKAIDRLLVPTDTDSSSTGGQAK